MRPSEIAKLAAGIAAGSLTYGAVVDDLDDDGDVSMLDSLLAGGASAITGALGGRIIGNAMDATGVSDLVDDLFDF